MATSVVIRVLCFLVLSEFLETAQSLTCTKVYGSNNIDQYHCPTKLFPKIELTIKENEISLKCHMEKLDLSLLPKLNESNFENLEIDHCNLKNFSNVLANLRLFDIKYLSFYEVPASELFSISKNMLSSLKSLEELIFISAPRIHFQKDFLENFSSLSKLRLEAVNLTSIDGYFEQTTKLKRLMLSINNIQTLPSGVFRNLSKLTQLHLDRNRIASLPRDVFSSLKNLKLLDLSYNEIEELAEEIFSDLVSLKELDLSRNRIKNLFVNILQKNSELTFVSFQNNNLSEIRSGIFKKCVNLQEIRLNENQLEHLPDKGFRGLKKLRIINLSENRLEDSISKDTFLSLESLEELNLSFNYLSRFDMGWFEYLCDNEEVMENPQRVTLDFSNNLIWNIDFLDDDFPDCKNILWEVFLHNNRIGKYPRISRFRIEKLDLTLNNIELIEIKELQKSSVSNIDLSHNNIIHVNFSSSMNYSGMSNSFTSVNLEGNPIECSCSNYDLIRYNNNEMPRISSLISIIQDGINCMDDTSFKNLRPQSTICRISSCQVPCDCYYKPHNNDLIMNCSSKNLTSFMQVKTDINLLSTYVPYAPYALYRPYVPVTHLDLSGNFLQKIDWISPFIKVLNLNNNKIKNLEKEFFNILRNHPSLEQVHLRGNLWKCTCESVELQLYLQEKFTKVNSSDVYCRDAHLELISMKNLCAQSPYVTLVLPIILGLLLFLAVALALYCRYQTEIKIFLYAKNMCLWFVSEKELDESKKYDVFLSFAQQDEDYVINQLLTNLENGDKPYKVCIHMRNFIPGELISDQILTSVQNSRRTLVVLSNNFLENVWGKMEFRSAHVQAINDDRVKVIIVIYGDIEEDKLDDELKNYLKTNTYIKWNDRFFWEKLRYALPHSRIHFYESNKRYLRPKLKFDYKFALVKAPPSPSCATSTPPLDNVSYPIDFSRY